MSLHHCGADHQGSRLAEARCEFEAATIESLIQSAQRLDSPPTAAQICDLWAHVRDMNDDGRVAARITYAALCLGWRPMIGTDS